jgi:hypothetical protein
VSRSAFLKAERKRRSQSVPSKRQRYTLKRLSKEAGIELPTVRWSREASDAIKRLKSYLEQPMLAGFAASTSALTKGEK